MFTQFQTLESVDEQLYCCHHSESKMGMYSLVRLNLNQSIQYHESIL